MQPVPEEILDGFIAPAPDEIAPSRYSLVRRLDTGGCGEVWLGEDTRLGSLVAIKKLHGFLKHHEPSVDSFYTEISTARALNSAHVVRIYDLIEIDRVPCLVMEYIEGKTLLEVCREAPSYSSTIRTLILHLCQAVKAIHDAGYVHADLNLQNVLVDRSGRLVVVDLGLARPGTQLAVRSDSRFRAPELATRCPDMRADVYACGDIMLALIGGERADIASLKRDTAPDLATVIARCLETDPDRRYQDGGALWLAVIASLSESAHRLERNVAYTTFAKRAFVAIVSIFLIGVVLFAAYRPVHAQSPRHILLIQASDDVGSRFITDIVSIYCEMNRLEVERPLSASKSIAVGNGVNKHNAYIALSLKSTADRGSAILISRESPSSPVKALRVTSRTDVAFETLKEISRILHTKAPDWSFQTGGNGRFLYLATLSEGSGSASIESEQFSSTIPELIVAAKSGAKRYLETQDVAFKIRAVSALDRLADLGVNTSFIFLLRASLEGPTGTAASVGILKAGLNQVITKSPLYSQLGEYALEAGFADEAIIMFKRALEREPGCARHYATLARAHAAMWKDTDAVDDYLEALKLNDGDAKVYSSLGSLYIRLNRYDDARKSLERSLEIRSSPDTIVRLGLVRLLSADPVQGIILLRAGSEQEPTAYSLGTLGAALRWTGDLSGSKTAFERAIKAGNENSQTSLELGRLATFHAQLHNIRKADYLLQKAASFSPSNDTELIYDGLIVDAFAGRVRECQVRRRILEQRHFPSAFYERDPQISAVLKQGERSM